MAENVEKINAQTINEIVANIPKKFNVDGREIEIKSRTIYDMVRIDSKITELEKILAEEIVPHEGETPIQFIDRVHEKNRKVFRTEAEIIHAVVNEKGRNEFSIDWIEENIDFTDGGLAEQIMDAYNEKCAPGEVTKKMLLSKKFT